MKRERSTGYPVLDLATAYRIVRQELKELGATELDRAEMAKRFGYQTALGGLAARKIGGLVHFGILDRRGNSYGLSPLGLRLQRLSHDDAEFPSAIRAALEQPTLFKAILERYRGVGQLPNSLAQELASFGITERVSAEVENLFRKSALFAGVTDTEGFFVVAQSPITATNPLPDIHQEIGHRRNVPDRDYWYDIPMIMANKKYAFLRVPKDMTAKDFAALEKILQTTYDTLPEHLGFERSRQEIGVETSSPQISPRPLSLQEARNRKR